MQPLAVAVLTLKATIVVTFFIRLFLWRWRKAVAAAAAGAPFGTRLRDWVSDVLWPIRVDGGVRHVETLIMVGAALLLRALAVWVRHDRQPLAYNVGVVSAGRGLLAPTGFADTLASFGVQSARSFADEQAAALLEADVELHKAVSATSAAAAEGVPAATAAKDSANDVGDLLSVLVLSLSPFLAIGAGYYLQCRARTRTTIRTLRAPSAWVGSDGSMTTSAMEQQTASFDADAGAVPARGTAASARAVAANIGMFRLLLAMLVTEAVFDAVNWPDTAWMPAFGMPSSPSLAFVLARLAWSWRLLPHLIAAASLRTLALLARLFEGSGDATPSEASASADEQTSPSPLKRTALLAAMLILPVSVVVLTFYGALSGRKAVATAPSGAVAAFSSPPRPRAPAPTGTPAVPRDGKVMARRPLTAVADDEPAPPAQPVPPSSSPLTRALAVAYMLCEDAIVTWLVLLAVHRFAFVGMVRILAVQTHMHCNRMAALMTNLRALMPLSVLSRLPTATAVSELAAGELPSLVALTGGRVGGGADAALATATAEAAGDRLPQATPARATPARTASRTATGPPAAAVPEPPPVTSAPHLLESLLTTEVRDGIVRAVQVVGTTRTSRYLAYKRAAVEEVATLNGISLGWALVVLHAGIKLLGSDSYSSLMIGASTQAEHRVSLLRILVHFAYVLFLLAIIYWVQSQFSATNDALLALWSEMRMLRVSAFPGMAPIENAEVVDWVEYLKIKRESQTPKWPARVLALLSLLHFAIPLLPSSGSIETAAKAIAAATAK